MTNEELIQKAKATHYLDWDTIDPLIKLATDEATKATLKQIMVHKYHIDESKNHFD